MQPQVRDLYKRFLIAGKEYPQGLAFVRQKAKEAFYANRDVTNEIEVKKAIAKGRYYVRELVAVTKLHKYRAVKKRYEE
jgi:hypothetical protein